MMAAAPKRPTRQRPAPRLCRSCSLRPARAAAASELEEAAAGEGEAKTDEGEGADDREDLERAQGPALLDHVAAVDEAEADAGEGGGQADGERGDEGET